MNSTTRRWEIFRRETFQNHVADIRSTFSREIFRISLFLELGLNIFYIFRTGGSPLPPDEILSSYSVGGSVDVAAIKCLSLCMNESKCVGFNVKASFNDENCQLTNVTKSKNENKSKKGEWKLFRDFEAVCGIYISLIVRHLGRHMSCSIFQVRCTCHEAKKFRHNIMHISLLVQEIQSPRSLVCTIGRK